MAAGHVAHVQGLHKVGAPHELLVVVVTAGLVVAVVDARGIVVDLLHCVVRDMAEIGGDLDVQLAVVLETEGGEGGIENGVGDVRASLRHYGEGLAGEGVEGVPDGGDPVVLFDQGDGAAVQVVLQNLVAGVEVERVAVQGQGVGQGGIFFGICLEQQILILYQLTGHGCTAGGGALASGVVQQDGFPRRGQGIGQAPGAGHQLVRNLVVVGLRGRDLLQGGLVFHIVPVVVIIADGSGGVGEPGILILVVDRQFLIEGVDGLEVPPVPLPHGGVAAQEVQMGQVAVGLHPVPPDALDADVAVTGVGVVPFAIQFDCVEKVGFAEVGFFAQNGHIGVPDDLDEVDEVGGILAAVHLLLGFPAAVSVLVNLRERALDQIDIGGAVPQAGAVLLYQRAEGGAADHIRRLLPGGHGAHVERAAAGQPVVQDQQLFRGGHVAVQVGQGPVPGCEEGVAVLSHIATEGVGKAQNDLVHLLDGPAVPGVDGRLGDTGHGENGADRAGLSVLGGEVGAGQAKVLRFRFVVGLQFGVMGVDRLQLRAAHRLRAVFVDLVQFVQGHGQGAVHLHIHGGDRIRPGGVVGDRYQRIGVVVRQDASGHGGQLLLSQVVLGDVRRRPVAAPENRLLQGLLQFRLGDGCCRPAVRQCRGS